jgi:hypothetical protein
LIEKEEIERLQRGREVESARSELFFKKFSASFAPSAVKEVKWPPA